MRCLENLVGIRGLCEPEDPDCIYVNDLPMGSLKRWAQTADHEKISGKTLFEKLRTQAAYLVGRDFLNKQPSITIDAVDRSDMVGKYIEGQYVVGQGAIMIEKVKDPYLRIEVPFIEFWAETPGAAEITVNGDAENVDVKKGINRYFIKSIADCYIISIDSQVKLKKVDMSGGGDSCGCSECYEVSPTDIFRVVVNCTCDEELIVCRYANHLKYAVRWRLMALLMENGRYRDDKSILLRNSRDEMIGYHAQIMGGEDPQTGYKVARPNYWVELSSTIKRINLKPSKCLSCRGGYSVVELF